MAELLTHVGKISHKEALTKSNKGFERFKTQQRVTENEYSLKEIE